MSASRFGGALHIDIGMDTETSATTRVHGDAAGSARAMKGLLDVAGLAARLGVSDRHVRRLVAERRIPFIKWGHLLRFDPGDVDRWIDDQRVEQRPPRGHLPAGTLR